MVQFARLGLSTLGVPRLSSFLVLWFPDSGAIRKWSWTLFSGSCSPEVVVLLPVILLMVIKGILLRMSSPDTGRDLPDCIF